MIVEVIEYLFHVKIERFSVSTWFFRTVKYSDAFDSLWKYIQQVFCREGSVEMNRDKTQLLTLCRSKIINGFLYCCLLYTSDAADE